MLDIFGSNYKKHQQKNHTQRLINDYILRNPNEFLSPAIVDDKHADCSSAYMHGKNNDISDYWHSLLRLNKSTFMSGWKPSPSCQYNSLYEQLFYHHFEYPAEIEAYLRPFDLQWYPPHWFEHGQSLKASGRMGQVYLASSRIPYQKKNIPMMIREINLAMMKQQSKSTLPKQVIGITAIKHKNSPHHQLGLVSMAHEYSLEQLIVQVDQWTFQKIYRIAIALTSALRDLHRTGRVHPNLQPKNILISNIYHNEDKLQLEIVDAWPLLPISARYGRWPYISPEICYSNTTTITQQSNIYSLGIILWQLVSGVIFPSGAPVDSEIYKLTALKHIDPAYQELIVQCLSKEPETRPNAETVCEALTCILMMDMTLMRRHKQDLISKHSTEVRDNQMKIAKYLANCPDNKQALHDLIQGAAISKRVMLQLTLSMDYYSNHQQQKEEKEKIKTPMQKVRKVDEEQDKYCEDENGRYMCTATKRKQKYKKRPYRILPSKNDLYYSDRGVDLPPSDLMQVGGFA